MPQASAARASPRKSTTTSSTPRRAADPKHSARSSPRRSVGVANKSQSVPTATASTASKSTATRATAPRAQSTTATAKVPLRENRGDASNASFSLSYIKSDDDHERNAVAVVRRSKPAAPGSPSSSTVGTQRAVHHAPSASGTTKTAAPAAAAAAAVTAAGSTGRKGAQEPQGALATEVAWLKAVQAVLDPRTSTASAAAAVVQADQLLFGAAGSGRHKYKPVSPPLSALEQVTKLRSLLLAKHTVAPHHVHHHHELVVAAASNANGGGARRSSSAWSANGTGAGVGGGHIEGLGDRVLEVDWDLFKLWPEGVEEMEAAMLDYFRKLKFCFLEHETKSRFLLELSEDPDEGTEAVVYSAAEVRAREATARELKAQLQERKQLVRSLRADIDRLADSLLQPASSSSSALDEKREATADSGTAAATPSKKRRRPSSRSSKGGAGARRGGAEGVEGDDDDDDDDAPKNGDGSAGLGRMAELARNVDQGARLAREIEDMELELARIRAGGGRVTMPRQRARRGGNGDEGKCEGDDEEDEDGELEQIEIPKMGTLTVDEAEEWAEEQVNLMQRLEAQTTRLQSKLDAATRRLVEEKRTLERLSVERSVAEGYAEEARRSGADRAGRDLSVERLCENHTATLSLLKSVLGLVALSAPTPRTLRAAYRCPPVYARADRGEVTWDGKENKVVRIRGELGRGRGDEEEEEDDDDDDDGDEAGNAAWPGAWSLRRTQSQQRDLAPRAAAAAAAAAASSAVGGANSLLAVPPESQRDTTVDMRREEKVVLLHFDAPGGRLVGYELQTSHDSRDAKDDVCPRGTRLRRALDDCVEANDASGLVVSAWCAF